MTAWFKGMALAGLASAAMAQETARVLSAVPVVQSVTTAHQVCGGERLVQQAADPDDAGALVGTIAGGLAGHAAGRGDGRGWATLIGAVFGALAGERLTPAASTQWTRVRDCAWVSAQQPGVVGYDVRYEYAGREYSARLTQDPGPTVTVQVAPSAAVARPTPRLGWPRTGGEDFSGY